MDGPVSMLGTVERNLPRLDQYLCTGLGVRSIARRDALIADAMLPFIEDEAVDATRFDEITLFGTLRRAAYAGGLAQVDAELPSSGSARLRDAVRTTTREVRAVLGVNTPGPQEEGATVAVAAQVAIAVIRAPVWFVEPELPPRLARAYAICSAAITAASSRVPEPLLPGQIAERADELARAYAVVWKALPAATVEARVLWELDLYVSDIARVLSVSPPAVDTALLQLLAANKVFDILVGREPASQLEHGPANRSYERLMRDML